LAGALVFVLGLIWATTWAAKRLLKGRWSGGADTRMCVLERLHLAPKKSVEIVSIGKRVLVLGVTESQIGLLTELTPADLPQPGTPATAGGSSRASAGRQRAILNEARHKLSELFRSARPSDVEAAPSR
jgi:flagellar protein FliO/FliZ